MKLPETYLIEKMRPEAKHILELLTLTKEAKENVKLQGYYKKLAEWGTTHLQKAGKIELDKIKLTYKDEAIKLGLPKYHGALWGTINELIRLKQKPGLKEEDLKVIQQTTLEILGWLSKIKPPQDEPEDPEDEPEDEPEDPEDEPEDSEDEPEDDDEDEEESKSDPDPKSGKGRDWTAYRAKKLASGKPASEALKEFYDEYYSIEYAGVSSPEKDTKGIVTKLRSLDKILTIEFNKLGYNPEVNPFASFLKILIKEKETGKSDIFEKLTYNTYGAIHNAFIERYITGNMLGQKFDETNILFCSDLYNKNGLDMLEYLHLQKQTRDAKEKSEDATDSNLVAKIFIHQNIPTEQDGEELSYSAKVEKLRDLTEVTQPGNKDAKLKSLLEVRELYKYIFGDETETTGNKQKFNLQIKAYIVDDAEKRGHLLNMIDYILDQAVYAESRAYAEEARKIATWLDKINYREDKEKKRTVKNVLSNYKLSATEYHELIVNLQNRVEELIRSKK